jgi:glycosyltransferase involved in cell wall biosynthesis
MKILYTNFHHRNGGGHVTYIINLLKGLVDDHQLSVATPGTSRLFAQAGAINNVTTYDMRFTSRIGPMLSEVRALRRLLVREQFDIVHVNASADHRHVMLACQGLARRPAIVWTKHNDHPVHSFGHRLRARFGTNAVIAVSSFVQSMLDGSAYSGLPRFVVRHGIDTDFFKPVSAQQKTQARIRVLGDAHPDLLVFGSSGGTDYEKGWLDLVAAVASLPQAEKQGIRIVVAGDPPKPAWLQRVEQLGMTPYVVFPGLLQDVRSVLGACDVGFVLSYREALSFACRETMALGLPALVSNAGGLPENVTPGRDGWVVPAGDVQAIAQCVRGIVANPGALAAMGTAARAKSENDFGLSDFCRQTVQVYARALEKS